MAPKQRVSRGEGAIEDFESGFYGTQMAVFVCMGAIENFESGFHGT